MKKTVSIILVLSCLLVLLGCGQTESSNVTDVPNTTVAPTVTKGDFTMEPPDGYTIADISDMDCSIIRNEDGAVVGGIILTQLTEKSMEENIRLHLNSITEPEFYSDYFSWNAESEGSPVKLVSHYVRDRKTNELEEELQRIIYVEDGDVYDMWFDTKLISMDEIDSFYALF